ncbi:hypothetical protein HAX54_040848 [Datura stramonium]|uniref:Uncharacterized protein n=1 Tax=Datura stramonium TaxID=4076 RepID=A0ABS8VPJ9_DATST|nr:hypothetical protein [Datura stramonium]
MRKIWWLWRSAIGRKTMRGERIGGFRFGVSKKRNPAVVLVFRLTVACDSRKTREEKVAAKMEVSGRWFACNYGGGDAGFLMKKVRGGQFGEAIEDEEGCRRGVGWRRERRRVKGRGGPEVMEVVCDS